MAAPVGAPAPRLKVRVCDEPLGSLAVTGKLIKIPSLTVRLVKAPSTGARFTSTTVTTKLWVALRLPSLTITRNAFVVRICPAVGVHVNNPPALTAAPVGAPAANA